MSVSCGVCMFQTHAIFGAKERRVCVRPMKGNRKKKIGIFYHEF